MGPLTLYLFEDINQKCKLQEQLLARVLDHATIDNGDKSYFDRLAIVIALVQDNGDKFGLNFPSAEKIVEQRQKLSISELNKKIDDLTIDKKKKQVELNETTTILQQNQKDLAEKNEKIKKIDKESRSLAVNSKVNKEKIAELAKQKSDLEKSIGLKEGYIDELKKMKDSLQVKVSSAEENIKQNQERFINLEASVKKSSEEISSLEKRLVEKEEEIKKLKKDNAASLALINAATVPDTTKVPKQGGFKSQLQQLMFSSDFSELYIMQELSVDFYR